MINPFKMGRHIVSNGDARGMLQGVPILNNLLTQGSGVGMRAGREAYQAGKTDIQKAQNLVTGNANRVADLEKKLKYEKDPEKIQQLQNALELRKAQTGKYDKNLEQVSEAGYDTMAGGITDMAKSIPNYFMATDMRGLQGRAMVAGTRIGVGAGVYMGGAAGLRYMSGGGLTYNNAGEQDIAGIPFI